MLGKDAKMTAKYQRGVSLIEILVTALILGIGLLGVAALQVSSVSGNLEGFYQSQATSIAEDAASRIRASKIVTALPGSTTDHATYIANYVAGGVLNCAAAPAQFCRRDGGTAADNCTLAQLATFDQWELCSIADNTLPEGRVYILGNLNRVTIAVEWASARAKADIGQVDNLNQNCVAITGNNDRNCVIVELVP